MHEPQKHPEGTQLDPFLITFLLDHPSARSIVYSMMQKAAQLCDDEKMIAWYAPIKKIDREHGCEYRPMCEEAREAYSKLWETMHLTTPNLG